jgi:hypothetical protein
MKLATAVTDLLAAPLFRTGADGRRVFMPSAMSATRYVIPDRAVEDQLRARMAKLMGISIAVSLVLITGAVMLFGMPRDWTAPVWAGIVSAFAAHFAINVRLGRHLARGLIADQTGTPLGLGRAFVEQAVAWPRWMSWLQMIVGPLVLWGGVLGYQDAATSYDTALSVLAVPLGFLMIAYGLAGLLARR